MATISEIKGAVREVLLDVPGVTTVELRRYGQVPWARRKQPGQSFWWVDVQAVSHPSPFDGLGTRCYRVYRVRVEGWLPFSYERPDSTTVWDALLEDVLAALEANRTLGRTVNNADLPELTINELQEMGSSEQDVVVCHHVVILFAAYTSREYETT